MPEDSNAEAQAASDVDDIKWVAVSALREHEGVARTNFPLLISDSLHIESCCNDNHCMAAQI